MSPEMGIILFSDFGFSSRIRSKIYEMKRNVKVESAIRLLLNWRSIVDFNQNQ